MAVIQLPLQEHPVCWQQVLSGASLDSRQAEIIFQVTPTIAPAQPAELVVGSMLWVHHSRKGWKHPQQVSSCVYHSEWLSESFGAACEGLHKQLCKPSPSIPIGEYSYRGTYKSLGAPWRAADVQSADGQVTPFNSKGKSVYQVTPASSQQSMAASSLSLHLCSATFKSTRAPACPSAEF